MKKSIERMLVTIQICFIVLRQLSEANVTLNLSHRTCENAVIVVNQFLPLSSNHQPHYASFGPACPTFKLATTPNFNRKTFAPGVRLPSFLERQVYSTYLPLSATVLPNSVSLLSTKGIMRN